MGRGEEWRAGQEGDGIKEKNKACMYMYTRQMFPRSTARLKADYAH